MKKVLVFILCLFMFSSNVFAASLCSYSEQSDLNAIAGNVKVSYDIRVDTEPSEYETIEDIIYETFEISIANVTEDIYVKVVNDYNDEELTFNYEDALDGIITFDWVNISVITNFTIYIYSSSNTSCPDERYKTIYLTTPMYNRFADYAICEDMPEDFSLCQRYVTTDLSDITESEFFSQIKNYQTSNNADDDSEEDSSDQTVTDKIFNFLDSYKLFILGGIIIVVVIGLIVYNRKTKKQREFGLK